MFQSYFKAIQENFLADNESSEHTYRTYLQNLLSSFEKEFIKRDLHIKHEPTKLEDKGRPDFKVSTKEQLTIGLIETKKIGEDLTKILDTKQLSKYKQLSDNIIVTDYLHFYLLKKGEPVYDTEIFPIYSLNNKRYKIEQTRIIRLTELFTSFFESEPDTIYKTQDLALKLSEKAKFLNIFSADILKQEFEEPSLIHGLYDAFKNTLLPLLDTEYFADIYAQTLTYGLFLAALNCNDPKTLLNKETAYSLLPNSFPLIKELFHSLDNYPSEIVWSIEEIISILKATDFTAIKKEFADYRHKEQGFNDPFIFFYEDFLRHYDKKQKELRGVYYTPEAVVSFIVRSIEVILKDTFGISDGFINNKVTLLDFAAGTGTFLLHAFKLAIEEAQKFNDKPTVNKFLNEQIIDNFYGFELLVAPYVVAHLKISEFLKEQGYTITPGKRLNIYLTNTLTNNEPQPIFIMPNLSKEGKEANKIKNKDILVILGNPPYSGHSANKGDFIQGEMKDYYQVDGKPLGEKNPKWLQDDYVKFIRFAQWKMDKVERGVVGIITNHSYLDNPTFRGMRQSLMKSFDEIYILDLHGNAKKKEKSPDGTKDENVFDIQQGVSIALFIKKDDQQKACKVFHYDLFGVRESKYRSLFELSIKNTEWNQINPNSPFYLFKTRNVELLEKYNKGLSLQEIFKLNSVGIVTSRDDFVVDIDRNALRNRINDFGNLSITNHEIETKYKLTENSKFKIAQSRKIVNSFSKTELEKKFCKMLYRPFDNRYLFYEDSLIERMRKEVMINMQEMNKALCIGRQWSSVGSSQFDVVFASEHIVDFNLFRRGGENLFPLYILTNGEEKMFFGIKEPEIEYEGFTKKGLHKTDNFTKEFRQFIKTKYKESYSPEHILGYIYSVLHSPAYRSNYIEFLKNDFPKVPFTKNEDVFQKLSVIGIELFETHLMNKIPEIIDCQSAGSGDNFRVELINYKSNKVWFNNDRYIDNIPPGVWDFHIGGYQVLDKWLKERKKHNIILSKSDMDHFKAIVNILAFTIDTMHKIDDLSSDWI